MIAHRIGNRFTQTFHAACAIRSPRRWCLTGTPIQNSLDNYGALLEFLRLSPFIQGCQFKRWIMHPFSKRDLGSVEKLRLLIQATCLRRTKNSTSQSCELVGRKEVYHKVDLSPRDRLLHDFFQAKAAKIAARASERAHKRKTSGAKERENILPLINFLRLICNHGEHLLPRHAVTTWGCKANEDNPMYWDMQSTYRGCSYCSHPLQITQLQELDLELHCGHLICSNCRIQQDQDEEEKEKNCAACVEEYSLPVGGNLATSVYEPSRKIRALTDNIQTEQRLGGPHSMTTKRSVRLFEAFYLSMLS